MELQDVIYQIKTTEHCDVFSPGGMPTLRAGYHLPDDLAHFYQRCGDMYIHDNKVPGHRMGSPSAFVLINALMFPLI